MKLYLIILKFFFIGALFIITNNSLQLANPSDFVLFKEMYFQWIDSLFNYGSEITAYVIQSNWLPQ